MFADLLDDSGWGCHSHRGWTTLLSFALQVLAVGCLLLLPLFYPGRLPKPHVIIDTFVPAPPPAPLPAAPPRTGPAASQSNLMGDAIVIPQEIPPTVMMITDAAPPAPMADPSALGVQFAGGDPRKRGIVTGSIGGSMPVLPPPPPAVPHLTISHMMEGNLVYRVQPEYPVLARQARIQGTVWLRAIISRDGAIENLQALSGNPLLIPAALAAVRQWRYRPYVLNGEPVEVETRVTVNFILSGG